MIRTALLVLLVASTALASEEEVSVEQLLVDLASPKYQPRRLAVLACEGRQEPELLERLLVMANADPHPNIQGYAAEALATFDDPRIFEVLAGLTKASSPGVVHSAYVALGKHGGSEMTDNPNILAYVQARLASAGQ